MEHFFENIEGWFNFQSIYEYVIDIGEDGDHFVEVGAWKGRSAAFMAVEIANSGKHIKFDVVDTWKGSEEHITPGQHYEPLIAEDRLYEHFLENMKPVESYYTPIRMTSLEAAGLYKDNSLDFVLLDASHTYEDVKADIQAWLPKIKSGGILAGDDYHVSWPGVINAVNEMFTDVQIVNDVSWAYKKP